MFLAIVELVEGEGEGKGGVEERGPQYDKTALTLGVLMNTCQRGV